MIPGRELVRLLADPDSGLVVTPIIDADSQIGESSIDIRLGPDIIVSRRATGTTAFDPSDGEAFREGLRRRQEYVRRGIGDPFHLQPGEFVIARSLEYVALPDDISAEAHGRSSWGRLGLTVATATLVQPGFKGTITLELANVGNTAIVLEVGLCIAQLVFARDRIRRPGPRAAIGKAVKGEDKPGDVAKARRQRADEWWEGHRGRQPPSRYTGQLRPALSRFPPHHDLVWVAPMSVRYIVGLIGERFAGKSAVSGFLVSRRQFRLYRLSQFVYEEAHRRGMDVADRSALRQLGDHIRSEHGEDALARLAFTSIRADYLDVERSRPPVAIVVEGFKVQSELEAFQRLSLFRTLLVESEPEQRLRRALLSGELAEAIAAAPLPRARSARLKWLELHVDKPRDVQHPAAPLVTQAQRDEHLLTVFNGEGGVPALHDALRRDTVPNLERWWRRREA